MTDLLTPLRTFIRVVETASFTAVAAERNTSQPTISRQIALLEEHLGTRLFTRTTRALTLTEDGRTFYEHAQRVVEALAEAESAVGRGKAMPSGTLRLAVPVAFGRLHIMPLLAGFADRHKEVRIDLVMHDGVTDLVEEGIDLAIRIGEITDPGLIARRIGATRRVTVASPGYLARHGEPMTPADLIAHDCIVYTRLATGAAWSFSGAEGPVTVPVAGRFRANNSEAVREAVIAGLGIGVVPIWLFGDEVGTGAVRVVLSDYEPKRLPIHAVHPSRRFVPSKVRAMIDHLEAAFRQNPLLRAS